MAKFPQVDGQSAFAEQITASSVVLSAIINTPDLAVDASSIMVPGGQGTTGQNVTVNYTVDNLTQAPPRATGPTPSTYSSGHDPRR